MRRPPCLDFNLGSYGGSDQCFQYELEEESVIRKEVCTMEDGVVVVFEDLGLNLKSGGKPDVD